MTGLVRNGSSPWFALQYGADGSVFLTAKAHSYIPQCTLFLVTFASSGFIAVPFETDLDEFYVGWTPNAMRSGQERTIQIGGIVGPVLSIRKDGAWLQKVNGGIVGVETPFRPKGCFGYSVSPERAMLFPVLIRKDA
ncbi:MAG: hypothetical protein ACYC2S_09850 [Spirochaetales bacterium]